MEHPDLMDAIRFCRSIGSATGEFLQFDGMKHRTEAELETLLSSLKAAGIQLIHLTFYGTEAYHDRFAARAGDFRLMMDTWQAASTVGLDVSVSVPSTQENAPQIDDLLAQFAHLQTTGISLFVPHCEGRGASLENIRFTLDDYARLSGNAKRIFNRTRFRPEREWVRADSLPKNERRVLTVTLTPENIGFFEKMDFEATIAYLEKLDDAYYQAVPSFEELLKAYGDPCGTKMYSARDLYLYYQRKYIAEHQIKVYDMNDERQCFSRRF